MSQTLEAMSLDIETMRVRGAAAIARHGANALVAWEGETPNGDFERGLKAAGARLLSTRPTAVSLRSAIQFVSRRALAASGEEARRKALRAAAAEFVTRSEAAIEAIGNAGAEHVRSGGTYLTHCNSQAAVSVFRAAAAAGKRFRVVATETRPWRQGLLTVRDLRAAGVERVEFAVDSAMRTILLDEKVEAVFVGCDTLAANGDLVNKVGTSLLALACRDAKVPFYAAAETYKVDLSAATGKDVPIEARDAGEVVTDDELPERVRVLNPVFDVTPAAWVRQVFTELGPVAAPDVAALARTSWT